MPKKRGARRTACFQWKHDARMCHATAYPLLETMETEKMPAS